VVQPEQISTHGDVLSLDRPRGDQPVNLLHQTHGLFQGHDDFLVVEQVITGLVMGWLHKSVGKHKAASLPGATVLLDMESGSWLLIRA
jgi:hypothetical protein